MTEEVIGKKKGGQRLGFFGLIYHPVQGAGVWHVASISVEPH